MYVGPQHELHALIAQQDFTIPRMLMRFGNSDLTNGLASVECTRFYRCHSVAICSDIIAMQGSHGLVCPAGRPSRTSGKHR